MYDVCMYVCLYVHTRPHHATYMPQTEASNARRHEAHGRLRHVIVLDVRGLVQGHKVLKAVVEQVF